jgi:thioesterase domain-containing protein
VLYYNALAAHLGTEQPVYGLQTPGLDGRTRPHRRVEDLAAHHIGTLQAQGLSGPYRLCGHSFGAHVAFEMAQQLLAAGETIEPLVILDTPAPHLMGPPAAVALLGDADWLTVIAAIAGELLGEDIDLDPRALRGLPTEDRLTLVTERLQRAGWLAAGADLDPLRGLLQVYKTNIRARYRPEGTAPVEIVLFKADESEWPPAEPSLGWQRYAPCPVQVQPTPGGHLSMLREPQVRTLAHELSGALSGHRRFRASSAADGGDGRAGDRT